MQIAVLLIAITVFWLKNQVTFFSTRGAYLNFHVFSPNLTNRFSFPQFSATLRIVALETERSQVEMHYMGPIQTQKMLHRNV